MNEYKEMLKVAQQKIRTALAWMENRPIAAYFVLAAIIINAYCLFNNEITAWVTLGFIAVFLLLDFRKGVFFWCACSYFLYNIHTICYAGSVALVVVRCVLHMLAKEIKLHKFAWWGLGVTAALIAVSFVLGFESQLTSAGILFSNVLLFVLFITIFKSRQDAGGFVDAFYVSAFIFLGITIHSLIVGGADFSGRLRFEGNVRDLANSTVLAVFFWACGFISGDYLGNIKKPVQDILGVCSAAILVLTLSKGAILALVLSLLVYCVCGKHLNKRFWLLVGIAVAAVAVLQITGLVDFSRFLERNTDLNGRTRIWAFYFDKTTERGILGILFGLGPGNIKRVAVGEYLGKYYVHSTILDFYFSYGAVGFASFMAYLWLLAKRVLSRKNALALGLLLFTCASFFITGASTNTQLFIIFGYIWILCCNDKFSAKVEN